jgi:hypothetical protein
MPEVNSPAILFLLSILPEIAVADRSGRQRQIFLRKRSLSVFRQDEQDRQDQKWPGTQNFGTRSRLLSAPVEGTSAGFQQKIKK